MWENDTNVFFSKATMLFYIIWFLVISIVSVIDDVQNFMMADTAEVRLWHICVMKLNLHMKTQRISIIDFEQNHQYNTCVWY
jgi:hypothetical protein